MQKNNSQAQVSLEYLLIWGVVFVGVLIGAYVVITNFNIALNAVKNEATGTAETGTTPSNQEQGTLILSVTDAPVEGLKELNITLSGVEVHKDGKWFSIQPAQKSFELLKLADAAEVIGVKNLPIGKYTQVRLQVVKATIKFENGSTANVKVPSGEIKLVDEFTIEKDQNIYLYLDFKPESLIKETGNQFILRPVIKLQNFDEFGKDLCESTSCSDGNPCTEDSCNARFCKNRPVKDGVSCGNNGVCKSGVCVDKTITTTDPCSKINFSRSGQDLSTPENVWFFYPGSSVLSDLDGDKDLDLVQSGEVSDEQIPWMPSSFKLAKVKVFFNDGKGKFTDSGQWLGYHTMFSAVEDIDGDNDKDIVTGTWYYGASIKVYLNNGQGQFTELPQDPNEIGWVPYIGLQYLPRLADLDGDKDLDLHIGLWPSSKPGSFILLNDGKGNFKKALNTGLENRPSSLSVEAGGTISSAIFDFDKDGDNDLVEESYTWYPEYKHTYWIYKNNGSAQFTLTQKQDASWGSGIGYADFDRDGDIDFISASIIFKNDGNGVFTMSAFPYYVASYYNDPITDIDNVNGPDLFNGSNYAMLNNGDGTFTPCYLPNLAPPNSSNIYYNYVLGFGDVDGDGDNDASTLIYVYNVVNGNIQYDVNIDILVNKLIPN